MESYISERINYPRNITLLNVYASTTELQNEFRKSE